MSIKSTDIEQSLKEAGVFNLFTSSSLLPTIRYIQKMLEINKTMNLTKWTKDEDILKYHLLDSAFCLSILQSLSEGRKSPQTWLDLGTGCGFPGVVVLAAFPDWEITFMDSVGKKMKALQDCLDAAEWKAKTLTGRAEEIGQNIIYRESWDGALTRAVADFPVVLEYVIPLIKIGGYLVDWRTQEQLKVVEKSQNALKLLNARVSKLAPYFLPGTHQQRWLVVVEKLGKTHPKYPRPIGRPNKNPL